MQQQQQQQNNAAGAVVGTMANSPLGMNNIGVVAGHAAALQQHHQQQHVTPPPHGLGKLLELSRKQIREGHPKTFFVYSTQWEI